MLSIATVRARIVAADPGLTLLFLGLRATAAVGLSLAILYLAARTWPIPQAAVLVGTAISMPWSIAPNDADARAQRVSSLLIFFPAAATTIVGAMSGSSRVLSAATLLAVLFLSVYVRRYGPRGYAAGTIGVLALYMTLFSRATPSELPWMLGALAVADVSVFLARFLIFPDRPRRALRAAIAAFHARQDLIARTVARRGRWTAGLRRRIRHHALKLNEAALVIDDILRDGGRADSRRDVLRAETQTYADLVRIRRCAPGDSRFPRITLDAGAVTAAHWVPRANFQAGIEVRTRIDPTTRQAIQLTIGAALATAIGQTISPAHWYWAVLGAFVVYISANSLGETLRRASSRIVGTAAGALLGAFAGVPLGGHHGAAFVLLFVFLFGAVYSVRRYYGLMSFFITAVVSMLYLLLNIFNDQLLLLRAAETLAGAVCGAAAAVSILQLPTSLVAGSIVCEAIRRVRAALDSPGSVEAVRQFDESLQTARARLVPRHQVALLAACGYRLRKLALLSGGGDDSPRERRASLVSDVYRIIGRLEQPR